MGGPPSNLTCILTIRGDWDTERTRVRHSGKAAIYKTQREASEEINLDDPVILDFQPPDCEKVNVYCL